MSIKLALKKFAGRNEALLIPLFKFLVAFIALSRINSAIGFMARLKSAPITLIIALAASFLPLNLTIVILGFVVIAHVYALSMECALVVFALFMVLYLLYFRFAAKDSVGGVLTPLSFVFHMPYVMPVASGLTGTPSSMVSVGCGVVIYHVLHYIGGHKEELSSGGGADKLGQFKTLIDAIILNREMMALAVSFAATVLVVYIIRRLPIKYAWFMAIAAGELSLLIVTLMAATVLNADISFASLFLGVIVSTIVNLILQYFLFDLNYNRIEKVQFEDDEYYYYVKAVPKNEFVEEEKTEKKRVVRRQAPQARAQQAVRQRPVEREEYVERRPANPDHEQQAIRTAAAIRGTSVSSAQPRTLQRPGERTLQRPGQTRVGEQRTVQRTPQRPGSDNLR